MELVRNFKLSEDHECDLEALWRHFESDEAWHGGDIPYG